MIEQNLLYIAIFVFSLMVVGLILTALEFRYGDPHKQDESKQPSESKRS